MPLGRSLALACAFMVSHPRHIPDRRYDTSSFTTMLHTAWTMAHHPLEILVRPGLTLAQRLSWFTLALKVPGVFKAGHRAHFTSTVRNLPGLAAGDRALLVEAIQAANAAPACAPQDVPLGARSSRAVIS